jgi:hypothetical protein
MQGILEATHQNNLAASISTENREKSTENREQRADTRDQGTDNR